MNHQLRTAFRPRGSDLSFAFLIFAAIFSSSSTSAQGLYRCGNTYQDAPCANGKLIAGSAPNVAKPKNDVKPPPDPECIQRGVDGQKIVWAREGGMLEEQMLGKARTEPEKKLVTDVYKMRGSHAEIKAGLEALCMAEKYPAKGQTTSADSAAVKEPKEANPDKTSKPAAISCETIAAESKKLQPSSPNYEARKVALEENRRKNNCQ